VDVSIKLVFSKAEDIVDAPGLVQRVGELAAALRALGAVPAQ
jgi:hypothetical protein